MSKEKVILEFDTFMMFDYAHIHYAKDIVRVLGPRVTRILVKAIEDELDRQETKTDSL